MVHNDMRSHTRGEMHLGKVAMHFTSSKHKSNTKKSNKTEVLSVDSLMPHIIYMQCFLEEKGFGSEEFLVIQDMRIQVTQN